MAKKNVSSSARGLEHSAKAPKNWRSTPRPSGVIVTYGGNRVVVLQQPVQSFY